MQLLIAVIASSCTDDFHLGRHEVDSPRMSVEDPVMEKVVGFLIPPFGDGLTGDTAFYGRFFNRLSLQRSQ